MKRSRWLKIPAVAALSALIVPLIASSPAGAAMDPELQNNTQTATDQFEVANTPPRIWVSKGLSEVDGEAVESLTPMSTYEFEFTVQDDNTLWNSRVVVCFHNTTHPVGYAGTTNTDVTSFNDQSDDDFSAAQDCVIGGTVLNLQDNNAEANNGVGGLNDANPAGAIPNDGGESATVDTSRAESWRKARWVMKQAEDPNQPYGVDPDASKIINDTTNNGSWRLSGDLTTGQEATSNAPCTNADRNGNPDRWDSTMIKFKCSVRIGTLARATAGNADWDLFLSVIDAGTASSQNVTFSGDSFMNLSEMAYGNALAYCSALGTAHISTNYNISAYNSCNEDEDAGYFAPTLYSVATNLSIGTVDPTDFGTLTPPTQNPDGTNVEPPAPADTAAECGTVGTGEDAVAPGVKKTWCSNGARKIDNLVANTDGWKFKMKSGPDDSGNDAACNAGSTKIAPALGADSSSPGGKDYTCWYTTANSVTDQDLDPAKTFGVALWEPVPGQDTEWDADTMQPNMFALRCIAYPKDSNEADTYSRDVPFPANGVMNVAAEGKATAEAEVYVGREFKDIPLYEYQDAPTHLVAPAEGWAAGPPTIIDRAAVSATSKNISNRNSFAGMGSDNTSIDGTRIWQRLEYATDGENTPIATPYEAYVHCRLDTGYVRPGTYTGVVYVSIQDAA